MPGRYSLHAALWAAALILMAAAPSGPREDPLAAALALPVASELTGARDAEIFAWVDKVAGLRNIWTAEAGRVAGQVTDYREDDGQELSDLALSADGRRLAYVRGGDSEYPDDSLPNVQAEEAAPRQQIFLLALEARTSTLVGEGHQPAFAPGDERIAYTRRGEIWLWDGKAGSQRLASGLGEVRRLQWSPDGARLLFVSHRSDYSFAGLLDIAQKRVRFLPAMGPTGLPS